MFTGLIEAVRPVVGLVNSPTGKEITIDLGPLTSDAALGDSIAVNGVCLTISAVNGNRAVFDVMPETLRTTTLGRLHKNDKVNLERALLAQGRFGGHFVQGHVDGMGSIVRIETGSSEHKIQIKANPELMRYMIAKGSVAISGVSLTIVNVQPESFSVNLIPATLKETNLNSLKVADKVNIETDILVKTIMKKLTELTEKLQSTGKNISQNSNAGNVTISSLLQQGF